MVQDRFLKSSLKRAMAWWSKNYKRVPSAKHAKHDGGKIEVACKWIDIKKIAVFCFVLKKHLLNCWNSEDSN